MSPSHRRTAPASRSRSGRFRCFRRRVPCAAGGWPAYPCAYSGAPMGTFQEQKRISVIIPTLDAAAELPGTLAALAGSGLIREIIVSAGGARDDTPVIRHAACGRRGHQPLGPSRHTRQSAGPPLSPRGLSAAAIAQSAVPVAVFRRRPAAPHRKALRLMLRHLIVFARSPALGTGKRRLARDIGDIAALRFERLMLARLLRRLRRDRRWHLRLAVTPDPALQRKRLWPPGIPIIGQGGGDLGERMRYALATCPPGPAVLIGTDIPALGPHHIAKAFRLLGSHGIVFGPARDGGFWLVGARRSPRLPPLFGPVRWSGPHAFADALGNLPPGVSVGFAARPEDVDDGASYPPLAPRRGV